MVIMVMAMAMVMAMVMVICEVVGVLVGGFMVCCVIKAEGEEQTKPERRRVALVLEYGQKGRKRKLLVLWNEKSKLRMDCDGADKDLKGKCVVLLSRKAVKARK